MTDPRPRTIITADPELDDLNSMIRLLLHANELRIEGLIYQSSRFHWKGDGRGTTFFLPDREYDVPVTSFRWKPGERFIDDAVDAYESVQPNLAVHDPRYPTGAELRSVVREGNVEFEGDMTADTPGSQLIEEILLDDEPGPVHIQMWAGTSTTARALRAIEERYGDAPDWGARKAALSRKAIITKFASQDGTYDDYIRPNWPDIRATDIMGMGFGYFIRKVVLPQDAAMIGADWMREHVTRVGPLGGLYRVWGDGRQMVPGDHTDFFHLRGFSAEELTAQGFRVWTAPEAPGEFISEGDTPNMLNLFGNGLRGHEHPSYGGWAGRGIRTDEGPDTWATRDSVDEDGHGGTPTEYSATRWFGDAQRDFATRLQWSVTPRFEDANHHPVVTVSPGLDIDATPGATVELTGSAIDPDGDAVTLAWWQYREAGTYPGTVDLQSSSTGAVLTVPDDAVPGQTIHLILQAQDDAVMPLASYARVIVTVS